MRRGPPVEPVREEKDVEGGRELPRHWKLSRCSCKALPPAVAGGVVLAL